MSTAYGISRNIGSSTHNNYVYAPINAPLSTNQYPNAMPYHSYGTLSGVRPTPPQFYPSQEPPNATQNTNARHQYLRATSAPAATFNLFPPVSTTSVFSHSTGRGYAVSNNVNYTPPIPSSMYLNKKKSIAVGKSAYKVGHVATSPITTKNYYPSGTRSSLQRARSGGCTAPKKKGSIYNKNLTAPGICAWGAIPRQNY